MKWKKINKVKNLKFKKLKQILIEYNMEIKLSICHIETNLIRKIISEYKK